MELCLLIRKVINLRRVTNPKAKRVEEKVNNNLEFQKTLSLEETILILIAL
jgi:hypothetical protein